MLTFTIEEAAARSGATKHTLRYYEREGLLPPITKSTSGHRRYTEDDLAVVHMLQLLRATGMPIREMKSFVELTRAGDHTVPDRVEVLERCRTSLVHRMAEDVEHLAWLDRKLDYYTGLLALEQVTSADQAADPAVASRPGR